MCCFRLKLVGGLLLVCAVRMFSGDYCFSQTAAPSAPIVYVAGEGNATLDRDILDVWCPRSLDNDHGGFRSNFSRDWKPFGTESKYSVFQGRMTWICSQIVQRRPNLKKQYLPYVKHGIDYLTDTLWDKGKGGFYWGLSEAGEVSPLYADGKQLYGMSFAIYGLAAAYQATNDPRGTRA